MEAIYLLLVKLKKAMLILLLTLLPVLPMHRVMGQSTAPFLYYYSDVQSAFVIERADGSDRRILAAFSNLKEHIAIGPGWSQSGKWFAADIVPVFQGMVGPSSAAFVINREGGTLFSLLDKVAGNVEIDMYWSPTDDLLLVKYVSRTNNSSSTREGFYILDALTKKIIAENSWPAEQYFLDAKWTPDGKYVALYHLQGKPGVAMTLIAINGQSKGDQVIGDSCASYPPSWSKDGKVAYLKPEEDILAVENPTSGTQSFFKMPAQVLRLIDWSPDGSNALIYTANSCEEKLAQLWLLSLESQKIMPVMKDAQIPTIFSSSWSPSSKQALIISGGTSLYRIVPTPLSVTKVDLKLSQQIDTLILTSTKNKILTIGIQTPEKRVAFYIYDDSADIMKKLVEGKTDTAPLSFFSLSSDIKYLAYVIDGTGFIRNIATMKDIQITLLNDADNSQTGRSFANTLWHPTEDWVIVFDNSDGVLLANVIDVSKNMQRAIGRCFISLSCIGWLPNSSAVNF